MRLTSLSALVLLFALRTAFGSVDMEPQRLDIPHGGMDQGADLAFKIMVNGEEIGRIAGNVTLSNGRFFGVRWTAHTLHGWRAEVRDGEPNTLYVWAGGRVQLEKE